MDRFELRVFGHQWHPARLAKDCAMLAAVRQRGDPLLDDPRWAPLEVEVAKGYALLDSIHAHAVDAIVGNGKWLA